MSETPHRLSATYDNGYWVTSVYCPHEHLGADRPCAVWANEDGSEKSDECTFQQYDDACYLEDWLKGPIVFAPVDIVSAGSGDDWHAKAVGRG